MRSDGAEALWSAVMELAEADLDALPDSTRLNEVRELWPGLCAAQAQIARRIGVVHTRGAAIADGSISTQAWLRNRLPLAPGPASRLVKRGTRLDGLPDTAAALAAGEISVEHAAVIADAAVELGDRAVAAGVEKVLLDH